MLLKFTKMHGCGNDYIYVNCFETELTNPNAVARRVAERHYGVGSDGLIMICPSDVADAKMRMFNADGSEGAMCGNAIRCVGKYLYDTGLAKKETVTVETLSGIKTLSMHIENGVAVGATVRMGKASFKKEDVPVVWESEESVAVPLQVDDRVFECTAVSMGSAHCVCFVEDVQSFPLHIYGKAMEVHPAFPNRVNAEFVRVIDRRTIEMRVWERGSGETWACGTGSCASVAAAVALGHCDKGEDVTVLLKGGALTIRVTDDEVYMTGPAVKICDGVMEL
ncbi:MAG: diaminopimelate epimerase [Clostridia bacterium]|nr:diaminopimelate epimerase [Clostridia bacterium]